MYNVTYELLAWQHKSEQARIDKILDTPQQTNSRPINWDEIWEMLGWD